ncbi:hypothetical protein [Serratia quinivorans]|uniref:hypothetical protein n=1 Tax=Serratia quinivorans TaxID=137545 RepID=UPI00217BA491|nr:hypothetical protein [Serratia quinivorans]CAI1026613.1 Uncharacterized protein conserved in bacteria (DUF2326) [Serratia quinivorans]CAI1786067.1 Uncharacterized protein conserved in bacteria (DUF2326) [Serratia quinivorans]
MQLKTLKIYHNSILIRCLTFKDGVNIITNVGDNGNQIGKSTALRAVSFCLGSDGKNMWKDPDNGNENIDVKNFILHEHVVFELVLKGAVTHTLKRRLYEVAQKNRKVIKTEGWINDVHLTSLDKYKDELATAVFSYKQDKPAFNSIKNKFMRVERLTSNNSYKFLNVHTSDDEYTIIYSALFGFEGHDYLKKETYIKSEMSKKEIRKEALLNGADLIEINKEIDEIDIEIEHFRSKESDLDMSGVQSKFIDNLRGSRSTIASLSSEIATLETRLIYNKRTIDKYNENIVAIDIDKVDQIYNEAIKYIPDVKVTIEETIAFHNAIFIEKARQSESKSTILMNEISLYKDKLNDAVNKERAIVKELAAEGQLDGLILIEKEIQALSERKGRLLYVFDEVHSLSREVRGLDLELQKLKDKIEGLIKSLRNNIKTFNKHFSSLTRLVFKTHANSLNVSVDEKSDLRFSVVNSDKNTGDGAPRAEAMAFDISMVQYMRDIRSRLPYFTLQDYLESVDEDKLNSLLLYAEKNNVQVVLSILNDKLNIFHDDFLIDNVILELSPDNKFFNI